MFEDANLDTPVADLNALKSLALSLLPEEGGLRSNPRRWRFVEIGSWAGRTALTMANAHPRFDVHCIDTWLGSKGDLTSEWAKKIGQRKMFETFCRNVGAELLMSRIFPHVGTSELWASVWPWQADLVFIDGEHTYEGCREDIKLWTPHVRPGGILCGHDYGGQFPGVKKAVDETGGCEVTGFEIWSRRIPSTPR